MRIVALINQKGGVGKTTLASTLAVLAHQAGFSTALLDTDPQAGLARWYEDRKKIAEKEEPRVLIANDEQQPDRLRKAANAAQKAGIEWLFIDTVGGLARLPVVAAELADIILIPCSPSKRDLIGTVATVKLVRKMRKRGYFVINKGSNSKAINDGMATSLSANLGLPCAGAHIQRRQPTVETELTGETLPEVASKMSSIVKGQTEFQDLWVWLQRQFEEETDEEMLARVQEG